MSPIEHAEAKGCAVQHCDRRPLPNFGATKLGWIPDDAVLVPSELGRIPVCRFHAVGYMIAIQLIGRPGTTHKERDIDK